MDKLDARLKDLISYINQNSKFDIYVVELDFYKHNEFEVVILKLYGAEVRKEVSSRTAYVQNAVNGMIRAFVSRLVSCRSTAESDSGNL